MNILQIVAVFSVTLNTLTHSNEDVAHVGLVETGNFVRWGTLLELNVTQGQGEENPCKRDGSRLTREDDFAIVPISSLYYLASRSDLIPVACVSNLIVFSHTSSTNLSIAIPITSTCIECPSNYFYLSPSALGKLHLGEGGTVPVAIDNSTHFNLPELWPKRSISRDDIGEKVVGAVRRSIVKNSLPWGAKCNVQNDYKRSILENGNFSHMFQQDREMQNGLELNHKLDQIDRIPGPLCNIYKGLTCNSGNRCRCTKNYVGNQSDEYDAFQCIESFEQEESGRTCMLDLQFAVERSFGAARVAQLSPDCFLHKMCKLLQDGEMCYSFQRQFPPNANPAWEYNYLERFRPPHQSAVECICMHSDSLMSMTFSTEVILKSLKIFSQQNVLNFGAKCNAKFEDLRRSHSQYLHALDGRVNTNVFEEAPYHDVVNDIGSHGRFYHGLKVLVESNGTFCKSYQHLVCNASELCACDTTEADEGVEFVREEETCFLKTGSICDPEYWSGRAQYYVKPYEDDSPLPKCQSGVVCVDPMTGKLCPRNETLPRIYFADKIFPYLSPEIISGSEDAVDGGYCRCGQTFEKGVPLAITGRNVAIGVVPVIVLFIVGGSISIWNRRRLRKITEHYLDNVLPNVLADFADGHEVDTTIVDEAFKALCARYRKDQYEIGIDCITFGDQIGHGAFGIVRKGTVTVCEQDTQNQTQVAIKNCTFSLVSIMDSVHALLAEIKLLQYIQQEGIHPHVVAMLHAVTALESGAPMLLLEFCERGNLKSVLTSMDHAGFFSQIDQHDALDLRMTPPPRGAPRDVVCTRQLLLWALPISNRMAFLHDVKRLIHCDLFTKNVVVDSLNVAKVCDFGIAKRLPNPNKDYARLTAKEIRANEKKFWPPEAHLDDSKLAPSLDVWTFGAVLWEIFNLGKLGKAVEKCKTSVAELGRPAYASKELDILIRQCWIVDPDERIAFGNGETKGLVDRLQELLGLHEESEAGNANQDMSGQGGAELNRFCGDQALIDVNSGNGCMVLTEINMSNS